jgi:hypothetical protein
VERDAAAAGALQEARVRALKLERNLLSLHRQNAARMIAGNFCLGSSCSVWKGEEGGG